MSMITHPPTPPLWHPASIAADAAAPAVDNVDDDDGGINDESESDNDATDYDKAITTSFNCSGM